MAVGVFVGSDVQRLRKTPPNISKNSESNWRNMMKSFHAYNDVKGGKVPENGARIYADNTDKIFSITQ
jgi:hypothetical protein